MAGYLGVYGDEHLEVASDEELAGHGDGVEGERWLERGV